jgi:signal transduction histidine kinase
MESSRQRQLTGLESLLQLQVGELRTTMIQATDLLAQHLQADKVDAFFYDSARDSLNAISSSNQPLSALQRKLGLDVLPLSNGGRVAWVYQTGQVFVTGRLQEDPEELRGVREGLGIKSKLGVPLEMGGKRRGMIMIASLKPDYFTSNDVEYAQTLVRWIGVLAHRAELIEQTRRNAIEQSRRTAADELVAVVSHDLRNYLNPVVLRLQALRTLITRDARSQELLPHVDRIARVLDQMGVLVSDLLDVARLDQGLFRIKPGAVDLPALIRESASALSTPDRTVDVRVQATGHVVVLGDAARIRQCVDNLIVNAVEQSPQGGTVTVIIATRTEEDGEMASIDIIDEGPGVPSEILPRIFERHATGRAQSGGLGLGLFLAKRIAELHGGDLTVESVPGKGARFRLSLPCELQPAPP